MRADVRHAIFNAFPAMLEVTVHVDPCECDPEEDYHTTMHHIDQQYNAVE